MKTIQIRKGRFLVNPFDEDIFVFIKYGWAIETSDTDSKRALDLLTPNSLGVLSYGNILLFESDTILEIGDRKRLIDRFDFYFEKERRQQNLFSLRRCYRAETAVAGFFLFASEQSKQRFIYLTHKSIAKFVGMWKETVTRTLLEFRKKKFIAYNTSRNPNHLGCSCPIELLNIPALKEKANLL